MASGNKGRFHGVHVEEAGGKEAAANHGEHRGNNGDDVAGLDNGHHVLPGGVAHANAHQQRPREVFGNKEVKLLGGLFNNGGHDAQSLYDGGRQNHDDGRGDGNDHVHQHAEQVEAAGGEQAHAQNGHVDDFFFFRRQQVVAAGAHQLAVTRAFGVLDGIAAQNARANDGCYVAQHGSRGHHGNKFARVNALNFGITGRKGQNALAHAARNNGYNNVEEAFKHAVAHQRAHARAHNTACQRAQNQWHKHAQKALNKHLTQHAQNTARHQAGDVKIQKVCAAALAAGKVDNGFLGRAVEQSVKYQHRGHKDGKNGRPADVFEHRQAQTHVAQQYAQNQHHGKTANHILGQLAVIRGQKDHCGKKQVCRKRHGADLEVEQFVPKPFRSGSSIIGFYGLHDIDPPWSI